MIVLGLTGSIGMGKSTTLQFFQELGIPTYSADAAVHALYQGQAAPVIEAAFPGTVKNGIVDRTLLSLKVLGNPENLKRLEEIVHPLVRDAERTFLSHAADAGAALAVVDIPLLFETGGESRVDKILVVTADTHTQQTRVLARSGMSQEKLDAILSRQMPDAQKRSKADFVIDTRKGLEHARQAVADIIDQLTGPKENHA
jgi:dephospho-CoA kinase